MAYTIYFLVINHNVYGCGSRRVLKVYPLAFVHCTLHSPLHLLGHDLGVENRLLLVCDGLVVSDGLAAPIPQTQCHAGVHQTRHFNIEIAHTD